MICKHCKTEIEPPGFASNWPLHTDAHCRDVLQADLEYALSELEGCRTLAKGLYDAHATIDKLTAENTRLRDERDHWKRARESAMAAGEVLKAENARLKAERERDAAEEIVRRVRRLERNCLHANGVHSDSCIDFGAALRNALGIDPSKEQGK